MEVGAKELTFIERSGLLFGFLFGCLQTCLWYFYQDVWVLPVGGFVVRFLSGGVSDVRGGLFLNGVFSGDILSGAPRVCTLLVV